MTTVSDADYYKPVLKRVSETFRSWEQGAAYNYQGAFKRLRDMLDRGFGYSFSDIDSIIDSLDETALRLRPLMEALTESADLLRKAKAQRIDAAVAAENKPDYAPLIAELEQAFERSLRRVLADVQADLNVLETER